MTQPGPPVAAPPRPAGTLFTSYYYRAGRRHNQLPRAPLVSDSTFTRHNGRANVLFSDGAVEAVTEADWRGWGFIPLEEIKAPAPPISGKGGKKGGADG
jgi:prepilin-type processing-associated H-X9-DG protein